jgi:hypothetical protein
MSNYLSKKIEYSDTIDTSAIDLFGKVAMMKQQKYDVAENQIQQTLDQYGSLGSSMREYGKNYLAGKLDEVTKMINQSGSRDLSKNGVARNIQQQIKTVVQDRTVLNEMTNGQKIASFQKEVSKIKEKNDGKYSDGNYQDALEQAGVNAWSNDTTGKVDKIGSLSYSNYVDVGKEQSERAQKYAKDMAPEQYLGTVQAGDTAHPYNIEKYGQRISTEELQRHVMSTMSEPEKMQMRINTRASIGKLNDDDFKNYMVRFTTDQTEAAKLNLAAMEAQFKGLSKEEQEKNAYILTEAKAGIQSNEEKIKLGNFDRSEMYSAFSQRQTREVASQWDKDIITKMTVDKMSYEMMKDDRDYALKLATLKPAKKSNDIAEGNSFGTATETIAPSEDKPQSDLSLAHSEVFQTATSLDSFLTTSVPNYKKMSEPEKWAYKLNLNPLDGGIAGNTANYKNLVQSFQESQKKLVKINSLTVLATEETTENVFNQLLAGKGKSDLNLENLSRSMPFLAGLLGQKEASSFSSLNPPQKLGVMAEITNNLLSYDRTLTDDERIAYQSSLSQYKAKLKSIGTQQSKEISNNIKYIGNKTREVSAYEGLKGLFGEALPGVISAGVSGSVAGLAYRYDQLINPNTAEKNKKERTAYTLDQVNKANEGYAAYGKFRSELDPFSGEDRNISELEARDLGGSNPIDVIAQFKSSRDSANVKIESLLKSYNPTLTQGKAYTFTTTNKSQSYMVEALRAALLNAKDKPQIPLTANDYTVQREGAGFRIGYNFKGEEGSERTDAYVSKLPEAAAEMFSQSQNSWRNDPKNENIVVAKRTIPPITNTAKRNEEAFNMSYNYDDALTVEQQILLETKPQEGRFQTVQEMKEVVIRNEGKEFYDKNIIAIEEILNRSYEANPIVSKRSTNNPFQVDMSFKKQGDKERSSIRMPLVGNINNDNSFFLQYVLHAYNLKMADIKALR